MIKARPGPAFLLCVLLAPLLSLVPPAAFAQRQGAKQPEKSSPYTLRDIVFRGTTPYPRDVLATVCGLKRGEPLTTEDMQAAAERLMATGVFSNVGATLEGPTETSINVVFTIEAAAAERMLRTSFDNFVWFSHDELMSGVQKRVPLFHGSVPEAGNMQDAVQDALQQVIATKGVTAAVSAEVVGSHPGQPFRFVEYRVTSPEVRIHRLDITGIPPNFAVVTNKTVISLTGNSYNDGLTGGLSDRILAIYRDAGYLEAALEGVTATIASSTVARVDINVAAGLTLGDVYHVSRLDWAGSPLMSSEAFLNAAKIKVGDVASQEKMRQSLENLDAAYRNHGYMDVVVDAVPKLDTAARQVAYTVTATPGTQYKLRNLNVEGLSPEQRNEFDSVWRLRQGDVYDAGYVVAFLKDNPKLLSSLSAGFTVSEEPESDVLDLTVTFKGGGRN